MLTHGDPHAARPDQLRTVHSQGDDRRSADRRQAEYLGCIAIPREVIGPNIAMRMKQRDRFMRVSGSSATVRAAL
jgi:hypothetical protein